MSEYTAEEYCEVLRAIYNMNSVERETVFGVLYGTTLDYILYHSAQEIIEMYRAYVNTPKVGECWKNNKDSEMVVVRYVDKDTVRGYYCDSGYNISFSYKYFVDNFTKTKHKSKYLELFIKEMEEVRNEQDKNRIMH